MNLEFLLIIKNFLVNSTNPTNTVFNININSNHLKSPNTMTAPFSSHYFIQFIMLALSVNIVFGGSKNFPSGSCLKPCGIPDIMATTLQKCIDLCNANGHCDSNRLSNDCASSSNKVLSCANGCEIAYHRSKVSECKWDCQNGASDSCWYYHPNILTPFTKCGACQEGCDTFPDRNSCSAGCDLAATLPEFYKYKEVSCSPDNIPRFLFAGQSNMVRR